MCNFNLLKEIFNHFWLIVKKYAGLKMTDADYLEYVDEQREFVDKYGDKTPEGKFIKSITYAFIEYLAYCNSIEVEK